MTSGNPARGPRIFPPFYFLLTLGLMVVLDRWAPGVRWLTMPLKLVGVLPFLVGLGFMIATMHAFRVRQTTIKPFEPSTTLVTGGPFRASRNPIYLGMTLMLLGIALFLGSATPLTLVVVFAFWIQVRFILKEEAHLTEQFGDAYRSYQASVRRWV
jgi:protein-S-isoprenylcysteine O-methyltransferase Ste14